MTRLRARHPQARLAAETHPATYLLAAAGHSPTDCCVNGRCWLRLGHPLGKLNKRAMHGL